MGLCVQRVAVVQRGAWAACGGCEAARGARAVSVGRVRLEGAGD